MRPDRLVLWLTLLAAATVTAVEWWRRRRPKGFTDWLKNPHEHRGPYFGPDEIDELSARVREIDEEKLRRIVGKQVWKGERDGLDERVLRGAGRPVQRLVLEILGDESVQAKLAKVTERKYRTDSPLHRACELLAGPPPCPEAVPLLTPFLDDASAKIRWAAAHTISITGAAESVSLAHKTLADDDNQVRSITVHGLDQAREKGLLTAGDLRELVPDLQRLISTDKNAREASKLLLHIDRSGATEFLLQPERFHAGEPTLHAVLASLVHHKVAVPGDRLRALVLALETRELEYPLTYALGSVLELIGQQRHAEDRDFIESRLNHPKSTVADGAAAALLNWAGMAELDQQLWRCRKRRPLAELPDLIRHYLALCALDGEVNNGGLAQYFFNPSGDDWREAMAGLEALGFTARLAILREAVQRFGADAPSGDRDMRQEQLSWLVRKNEKIFRDLDDTYFQCTENVQVFSARYAVAHAEEFRRLIEQEGADSGDERS